MRLYALGDTHLPSTRGKGMERFGWRGHPEPLRRAWDSLVAPEDVVLLVGDLSWATRLDEAAPDLAWLNARPGQKVLLKGNHDFWWPDSGPKLANLLSAYPSFVGAVQSSSVTVGPWIIAGGRLTDTEETPRSPNSKELDPAVIARELKRLETSLEDARTRETPGQRRIAVAHYPPLYSEGRPSVFSRAIEAWAPRFCAYGHLHGDSIASGFTGQRGATSYVLASCDAAGFAPRLLEEVG